MSNSSYREQRRSHFRFVAFGPVVMALVFLVFHYLRHHAHQVAK